MNSILTHFAESSLATFEPLQPWTWWIVGVIGICAAVLAVVIGNSVVGRGR